LSKFTEIVGLIKNRGRKNNVETNIEAPSKPSMTEGEKPKVHKVKKWFVYAFGAFIVVTLCSSIYFSSSDDAPTKATRQNTKIAEQDKNTPSYEDTLKNNKKSLGQHENATTLKRQTGSNVNSNGTTVVREQDTVHQEQPRRYSAEVYQPAYTAENIAASPIMQQRVQQPEQSRNDQKENLTATLRSAIRFAFGDENADGKASASATAVSNAAVASPKIMYTSASANTLDPGTLIPAVLVTGINTDVGGEVIAQTEVDVYDSLTGSSLLIPAGSRFIGSYTSGAGNGQSRVNVTWSTLLLPDGGSYALGQNTMVATDGAGYAGLVGNVNNHTSKILSGGAISSALGALASVAAGNTSSSTTTYSAGQLAAQGAASNLMNAASSLFSKNANIQATITVEPGYEFNIFVNSPVSFAN
jgi:type IV secretion system protein TrbI